jgi:hypothetical protein
MIFGYFDKETNYLHCLGDEIEDDKASIYHPFISFPNYLIGLISLPNY